MINRLKKDWVIHILCLFLTMFYLWGMNLVPFHPDESTQIFMSQDSFDFIKDPLSLSYSPGAELTSKINYRAIDMPLTRYLIGFTRFATSSPGLHSDWDWSLTWEQNLKIGAYPSQTLLKIARLIPTLLIPISVYLFYFAIRKVLPKIPALIAVLFLGLNPLILLHGRRAMAESALLFGITLFLWSVTRDRIKPILVGISIAVAFNAKQTGVFLIPAGIIAVCTLPDEEQNLKNMLARSAVVLAVFLIITLLLNPFYWKSPFSAIIFGYQTRAQLLDLQLMDHLGGSAPNILRQALNLISNVFMLPPAVSEIDNYLDPLTRQIQAYRDILPHSWGRDLIGGSIQLTIILSGFFVLYKRYSSHSKAIKNNLILLLITTFSLTLGILTFLPLPWQRYFIPLLPLIAFWVGYGFLPLSEVIKTTLLSRKTKLDLSK